MDAQRDLSQNESTLLSRIREARESGRTSYAQAGELGVDVEGAYRIQSAWGEGRRPVGYKLGLIGSAKQTQMGLDFPIRGRVYEDMLLQSPVRLDSILQPRIEPELAAVLADDLPPDASPGAARLAVGGLFLAVDFLSSVWEGYSFSAADVVADNASGGGFLLDERLLDGPPEGSLSLHHNGRLVAEGPIEAAGNMEAHLLWLAGEVGELEAGEVVFLGSPAVTVEAGPGVIEARGPRGSIMVAELQGGESA